MVEYDHMRGYTGGEDDLSETIEDVLSPFFADYCHKMGQEHGWTDCFCPDETELKRILANNINALYRNKEHDEQESE